jgi:hypothetical protein
MTGRAALKQWFETGDKPTQGQFAELIDSMFNLADDSITIAAITGLSQALAGKATSAQVKTVQDNITTLTNLLGNLADLQTTDKSTIVAAINEVLVNGGGLKPKDIGAGLIISNGLLTLDIATTALVNPAISVQWTLFNADGVTPYSTATSSAKALVVDKGVKASMAAKYKYPTPGAGQGLPTAAVSTSFSTALPAPDTFSDTLAVNNIAANRTDSITLTKPKSGLPVVNGNVTLPSGVDSTADSVSISFQGRGVLAFFPDAVLTAAQIQSALNTGSAGNSQFQTSKARSFSGVIATGYTYYLLSNTLGRPTGVAQNIVEDVFGAFQFLADVTIVNAAGANDTITVMRSNATNAFNNKTLTFS